MIVKLSPLRNEGVLPRIFRRIYCFWWRGHDYSPIAPEVHGQVLCECLYCRKRKVF